MMITFPASVARSSVSVSARPSNFSRSTNDMSSLSVLVVVAVVVVAVEEEDLVVVLLAVTVVTARAAAALLGAMALLEVVVVAAEANPEVNLVVSSVVDVEELATTPLSLSTRMPSLVWVRKSIRLLQSLTL